MLEQRAGKKRIGNCDDMRAGLKSRKLCHNCYKRENRERARSRSPSAFISNNSLSLAYCTLCTETASFLSQNKAPKISLPAHGTCIHKAACMHAFVCVCMCVCVPAPIAVGSEEHK